MPDGTVVALDIGVLLGLPGWMWLNAMPWFSAHSISFMPTR